MPDRQQLVQEPEAAKNMFVGKTGWKVENEGEGVVEAARVQGRGEMVRSLDTGSGEAQPPTPQEHKEPWGAGGTGMTRWDLHVIPITLPTACEWL